MGLREFQEKHRSLVMAGAGVVFLVAVVAIVMEFRSYFGGAQGTIADKAYFYDLGSGQLVVDKDTTVTPMIGKDGKTIVRAYVYSCGDCKDATNLKVAYLEKFSPEALTEIDKAGIKELPFDWGMTLPAAAKRGWLVGTSDDKNWYPRHSYSGNKLVAAYPTSCGSTDNTHECLPMP